MSGKLKIFVTFGYIEENIPFTYYLELNFNHSSHILQGIVHKTIYLRKNPKGAIAFCICYNNNESIYSTQIKVFKLNFICLY